MATLILILHLIVCVLLILIVLLQAGKGADMGTTFGAGASQTVFGSGGAAPFLTKLTTGIAIIFMLTSIFLTMMSSRQAKKSVVEGISVPELPKQGGFSTPPVQETKPEDQRNSSP